MKAPFSYVVLRYMHDVFTREFVNVGILLFVPANGFLRIRRLRRLKRVKSVFPGLKSDPLSDLLGFLESRCSEMENRYKTEFKDPMLAAPDLAKTLLPTDDSALQWSVCGTGVTEEPARTLDELFERLVTRHEEAHPAVRREDKDVWKPFEKAFRARHLLSKLQVKTMVYGDLRHRFENSWQPVNGHLRLFQPLSFDLIEPSDIVEKAVGWGGLVRQLRKADPDFQINLLLGRPVDQGKWPAFDQAQMVLQEDVPGRKRLILEERASEFAQEVEEEIESTTT